ncbi:MAG: hypothetical protein OXM61_07405 [Candidatus Poribacteria bacterium]|nr:hypothetical protein [Candidatus Poribacteria bacterium]
MVIALTLYVVVSLIVIVVDDQQRLVLTSVRVEEIRLIRVHAVTNLLLVCVTTTAPVEVTIRNVADKFMVNVEIKETHFL